MLCGAQSYFAKYEKYFLNGFIVTYNSEILAFEKGFRSVLTLFR